MLNTITALALVASASIAQGAPHEPRATGSSSSPNDSAYSLIADYSGSNFFNAFTTFVGPDPTNGHVNYTDMTTAASQKLLGYVYNKDNKKSSAYIGVDHTNLAPNGRNSVRLISKDTFNAGSMVVIDTNHIPVGDGLWPAIWMLGSKGTWPASGESDILEYVHETSYNGMTLHTAAGCNVANATQAFQGRLLNKNCNAGNAATGCSIAAFDQNQIGKTQTRIATAGTKLNKQGGGVYVHDWQPDGITVWMFPHGGLPKDLVAGKPQPKTWTQKPLAKFQGGCDFSKAFYDMNIILNIAFCGDWAGKTWDADGAAKRTGVATCNDYVTNNPKAFKDAYFDIQSIKFYSNNGQKPGKVEKRHEGHGEEPTFTQISPPFGNISQPGNTTSKPCDTHNMTMPAQLNTSVPASVRPPHPLPFMNGTNFHGPYINKTSHGHNCTTSSTTSQPTSRGPTSDTPNSDSAPHVMNRSTLIETSNADEVEVSGWLLGAGMFALFAFII